MRVTLPRTSPVIVRPLKKLAILSLRDISLISLVKAACVFFSPLITNEWTNERRARRSPGTKLVRRIIVFHARARMSSLLFQQWSPVAVAECAGLYEYSAHLFSHEAGTKRDRCVIWTRAHRHRTVRVATPPSLRRGAHLHLKFTRLYVPALISGTFKLVQLPSSNHLVVLNFYDAWGGPSPSPNFYTLTVAWRAFGSDPITPGKIPRDAAVRHVNLTIQNGGIAHWLSRWLAGSLHVPMYRDNARTFATINPALCESFSRQMYLMCSKIS